MNNTDPDARTAESLIRDLGALRDARCPACQAALGLRESLMNIAMGFKDAPRCLPCLCGALTGEPAALAAQVFGYIQRQDCFREAWAWACAEERAGPAELPVSCRGTTPLPATKNLDSSGPQAPGHRARE